MFILCLVNPGSSSILADFESNVNLLQFSAFPNVWLVQGGNAQFPCFLMIFFFFLKRGSTFGSTFPYLCITNVMLNKLLLLLTLQSNRGRPCASAQNKGRYFAP